jgi:hypothetical protein
MMGGGSSYSGPTTRSTEAAEKIFKSAVEEAEQARVRNVFISFRVEDEAQVNLFRHQAKEGMGIEFRDYSVKEPFDEKWKTNCKERIAQTSALICFIGPETAKSEAVNWEIEEAYRQGKKVIGVRIYKDENHPIPKALKDHNAPIVEWDNTKISQLLAEDD